MPVTTTKPTTTIVTALLAVRIPNGSEFDIATEAEQRIAAIEGVRAVSVDGLNEMQPRLSATVATVTVTIEATASIAKLREQFAGTVCLDSIDRMTRATN
ncbi:hypothetical protein [Halobacteriaceae bacterium SHR40]|uniref:hypothetical protein n=1 Tax=Halovenus amylolytica TaxID=2500550 RepID=UPI000FE2F9F5